MTSKNSHDFATLACSHKSKKAKSCTVNWSKRWLAKILIAFVCFAFFTCFSCAARPASWSNLIFRGFWLPMKNDPQWFKLHNKWLRTRHSPWHLVQANKAPILESWIWLVAESTLLGCLRNGRTYPDLGILIPLDTRSLDILAWNARNLWKNWCR